MQNLAGAMEVLKLLGLPEKDIFKALRSFDGAANRLEKLFDDKSIVIYKDFAHSPSKLKSTVEAVHELYPEKKIISCFELHTYSSLNSAFLQEYRDSLEAADQALVFYIPESLDIKKLDPLEPSDIKAAFGRDDLQVFTETSGLQEYLQAIPLANTVVLLMSSGNYGGLDLEVLISQLRALS